MTTQQAQRLVPAALPQVRDILLQAGRLPEWNAAFVALDAPATATVGERYPLTVRGGMRGYAEYTEIGAHDINLTWQFPGFHEAGTWHLEARGRATLVTHQFTHRGPMAWALRSAFAGVAELRLQRLGQRAATGISGGQVKSQVGGGSAPADGFASAVPAAAAYSGNA